MWVAMRSRFASAVTEERRSGGQTAPPAALWVFSTHRSVTGWNREAGRDGEGWGTASDHVGRSNVPRSPSRNRMVTPDKHVRGAHLVDVDVGVDRREDDVAGLGMDAQRRLVRHRARWDVHGIVLAEQVGHPPFQGEHRGVVVEHVVTHLGFGDRPTHRRRRLGDGVGAEVDDSDRHRGQPA